MRIEREDQERVIDLGSQIKGCRVSDKEIEMIRFLHEFGFCEINQIIKRFEIKKSMAYEMVKSLVLRDLMERVNVIDGRRKAHVITRKGVQLLNLDLPLVRKISLVTYEHHLAVIDVCIKLKKSHPEAVFISERRLRRDQFGIGFGKDFHMPDGLLLFPTNQKYAIEVEKTLKLKDRLETILIGYGLQNQVSEVWYFCSRDTLATIKQISANMPYVKIFHLEEFL